MDLRSIFVNRHDEIRSGWKILMYLLLTTVVTLLLVAPFMILKLRIAILEPLIVLISALAAAYVMTRYVNRKPFTAIGLSFHPATFKEFGIGCLLGFLMMSGIFVVEFSLGYTVLTWKGLEPHQLLGVVGYSAALFAIAALAEEVLFRGYTLQTLMQGMTFLPATILMAVVFSIAHASNPNASVFALTNVGLAAIWLSFAYLKTRSLWLPFGLHFSWNFSQTTVYSFPTSGIQFEDMRLFTAAQSGPEWITGGAFGPEGGVLATVAIISCIWYILKEKQINAPEGIITLDSVEDLLKQGRTEGEAA